MPVHRMIVERQFMKFISDEELYNNISVDYDTPPINPLNQIDQIFDPLKLKLLQKQNIHVI